MVAARLWRPPPERLAFSSRIPSLRCPGKAWLAAVPGACRPAPWTPAAARGCLPTRWASLPSPYPSYPEPSKALGGVGLWPGRGRHLPAWCCRADPARDQTALLPTGSWPSRARASLRPPALLCCSPALLACFKNCHLVGASGCTDRECGKIEAAEPGSWVPKSTKACGTLASRPPGLGQQSPHTP